MKIGFIGLGIMGRPMALNLKNAGHELFVPERASAGRGDPRRRERGRERQGRRGRRRGADPHGAGYARRGGGAVRRRRRGRGAEKGHARDRHVLDQPDRDQGIRQPGSTRRGATISTRRCPAARSAPSTAR